MSLRSNLGRRGYGRQPAANAVKDVAWQRSVRRATLCTEPTGEGYVQATPGTVVRAGEPVRFASLICERPEPVLPHGAAVPCGSLLTFSADQRSESGRLPRTAVSGRPRMSWPGTVTARMLTWKRLTEPPKASSIAKMHAGFGREAARDRPAHTGPRRAAQPICRTGAGPGRAWPGFTGGFRGGFDDGWLKVLRPVCDYIVMMRSSDLGIGRPGGWRAACRSCRWVCRRAKTGGGRMSAEVLCGR
jgi:hypothetical protein